MNRGEALQWGIELDCDGSNFFVTVHGSKRPDFRFPDIEAFIDWLREENEGLQIMRMARGQRSWLDADRKVFSDEFSTNFLSGPEGAVKVSGTEYIAEVMPCTCPAPPFPPRPGCPIHGASDA